MSRKALTHGLQAHGHLQRMAPVQQEWRFPVIRCNRLQGVQTLKNRSFVPLYALWQMHLLSVAGARMLPA